jgi:hypothetical protein
MERRQFMEIRWFRFFNRDTRYKNGTERERRMIGSKFPRRWRSIPCA